MCYNTFIYKCINCKYITSQDLYICMSVIIIIISDAITATILFTALQQLLLLVSLIIMVIITTIIIIVIIIIINIIVILHISWNSLGRPSCSTGPRRPSGNVYAYISIYV